MGEISAARETNPFDNFFMTKGKKIRTLSANKKLVDSRRKKIMEYALKIFRQKGLNGVTMEDVARSSRMSVGSIYRYFGSKNDLLLSFLQVFADNISQHVYGTLANISNMNARAALEELMRSYMRAVDASRGQVSILYLDTRALSKTNKVRVLEAEGLLVNLFEQIILRGIEERVFIKTDAKLCALNIKVLIDSWALRGWAVNGWATAENYINFQIKFVLDALSTHSK